MSTFQVSESLGECKYLLAPPPLPFLFFPLSALLSIHLTFLFSPLFFFFACVQILSARPFTSLSCTLRTLILLQTYFSCFLSPLPAFLHSSSLPSLMFSSRSSMLSGFFFLNFLFLRTVPSTLSLSPPPSDFSTSLHFVLSLCITLPHITSTTFFVLAHAACFSLPLKRPFLASPLFRYSYTSLLSSPYFSPSISFNFALHSFHHTYLHTLPLAPPPSTSSVPLLSTLLHSIISPFLSITSNFPLHPFHHAHPHTLLLWFSRSPRSPPGPSSASLCSGNDSSSSL